MPAVRPRIVVVGASSSIAEHCLRLWLARAPADIVLIGRDETRLAMVADDLRVRSPASRFGMRTVDFGDAVAIATLVASLSSEGPIDVALIAHGTLPDQREAQANLEICAEALLVNGVSAVLFAEAFAGELQRAGSGTLAVIGSVAGDRGRRSNYVYGAAKGLVDRYVQGLQHRFAGSRVRIVLVKPGPTDTPMTRHLKATGARLARVEDVAATIVSGIDAGRPVVYAPRVWEAIMLVIRHLPRTVFNRLDI
jgi:short-subunit dehydrogenase